MKISSKVDAFLKGYISAFDITGSSFIDLFDLNAGFERGGAALRGDWKRIGGDIRKAMNQVVHVKK
jgi:hypothetical protein